ncbi:MAG: LysR family transcriptional regulator [Spirochaetales bacterium]|nr:LysR family transcriptional regulator [Spirochaetales bacterium]
MNDYRINTIQAVVEMGSLKKASEKLGLTQPAVSQHIKYLEDYYGVPFFDHIGRKLVLNDAGRFFIEAANKSDLVFQKLKKDLSFMKEGRKQYVIGATLTIGEFILPPLLGKYKESHPEQNLTIHIENTAAVLALLDKGKIDLALVEGPFEKERYKHMLFLEDEMIFIGSRKYINNESKAIGNEELANSELILREEGSGTRFYWEKYCRDHRIAVPKSSVLMEVGSLSAIKALVEAGIGCSVMSKRAVNKELLLGTIKTRPFKTGPLFRDLYFVYNQDSPAGFIDNFFTESINYL